MPPKIIQHTNIASTLDACYLGTSAIKYSDDDSTKEYPFVWASLTDRTTNVFYSGLSIVFNTEECRLPICHMHPDSNSALCVISEKNTAVMDTLQLLQDRLENLLPGETVAKIIRCSDNPKFSNSKTICVKTRFTIFQNNNCDVRANTTLTKYILTIQKINKHDGKFKPQVLLTAVGACKESSPEDRGGRTLNCSQQAEPVTQKNMFDMMMQQ